MQWRQLRPVLLMGVILILVPVSIAYAHNPDFFDLAWGDVLEGPEWIRVEGHDTGSIIMAALSHAHVPDVMKGNEHAVLAFIDWISRQTWPHLEVLRRNNERSTVAGFPVSTIRYYTDDKKLIAVEVYFELANPDRIAEAIRARYGSVQVSTITDLITYEDERTKVTFLIRLLTLESVEHLRAIGDHIYADFLLEYETTISEGYLW